MPKHTQTPATPLWASITTPVLSVNHATRLPPASLGSYLTLAAALEAQQPEELTPTEEEALDQMVEGREVAGAIHDFRPSGPRPDLVRLRLDVVSLMASATGMVALGCKVLVPAVAARAREVALKVFGNQPTIARMNPHVAYSEVERVRLALAESPSLRRKLAEFVPPEVMEALFVANAALMDAYGAGASPPPEKLPIGRREAKAFLRRRITRYVRCIVASANEEDPLTVQRMMTALSPLRNLKEAAARKVRRTKAETRAAARAESEDASKGAETAIPPAPTLEAPLTAPNPKPVAPPSSSSPSPNPRGAAPPSPRRTDDRTPPDPAPAARTSGEPPSR